MDISILYSAIIFVVLLLFSGFFSASETAYFSLTRPDIERMRNKKDFATRQTVQLLTHPRKLLITIIVGNTVVNIAAASLAAIVTLDICAAYGVDPAIGVLIDIVVVTFVLLVFAEIIPKVAAVKNAKRFALNFSLFLSIFFYISSPIISVLHTLTQWLTSVFHLGKKKALLSEEELRSIVDLGEEKGALEQDEKEMIHSIFEFGETTVREIMVPRIDMVCVSTEDTTETLLNLINKHLHSRIPIFKEKIDNIVGIVYAKDLLPFVNKQNQGKFELEKLARPAYFVPEQKKIDELLREFQTEKIHMAIVVDEYGGTSGLVTLEDIIEEIVGEIQDEHDKELPQFQKISENEFIVDGGMDLEEINEQLQFDLPTEEGVETLAGFLFGLFGAVPREKEMISYNGYDFIVEKVIRRRIKLVRIKRTKSTKE